MSANTWTELDLGALADNVANLRSRLTPSTDVIFVVKADAYGHGMLPVARCARDCGIRSFAVAHMNEARALRQELPEAEIVILGAIPPAQAAAAVEGDFVPVIVSKEHARQLSRAVLAKFGPRRPLRCHFKIDTGMGRLGFPWRDAAARIPAAAAQEGLRPEGACTHFAQAGSKEQAFTEAQMRRFREVLAACETAGLELPRTHVSNSSAVLRHADWDAQAVRPGILLYGYPDMTDAPRPVPVKPVLQWKTRVLQVKQVPAGYTISYGSTHVTRCLTRIATLDAGYADGYHRSLSNRGIVLVGGRRCPVIGRVTMNFIMVDLGPEHHARTGDEAVLAGEQESASIWADELAELAGTIPYEILTSIRSTDRRITPAPPAPIL